MNVGKSIEARGIPATPRQGAAHLIDNIGELTTNDPDTAERLTDAAVVIVDGHIAWVGKAEHAPACDTKDDAAGRAVLPGWVDSHSHMVFAGDRTPEFEARMAGQQYAAGGIHATVAATRSASDEILQRNLARLLAEAQRGGTTTNETKTGYGLTTAHELRSAKIAAELVDAVTFLGAHVVPQGEDRGDYLNSVCGDMLSAVSPYVSAVDVFCETGAFDAGESAAVLRAARDAGLASHVHGNQLGHGPGVQIAVSHGALSVDHVNFLTRADVDVLADSWRHTGSGEHRSRGTVATVLPACDLSTRMPLAPARQLRDAGVEIAIASNCNPGTSYTTAMGFAVATAVLQMGLTVTEAVLAATLGGATALGMHEHGWIDPQGVAHAQIGVVRAGAQADLQLIDAPSVTHFAYRPGVPLTSMVWKQGVRVI